MVKKCNRANKRSYLKDLKGPLFYERAFLLLQLRIHVLPLFVQKTVPGNGGQQPQRFFKIGENEWIEGHKWFEAIRERKAGTATKDQLKILEKGHWKD